MNITLRQANAIQHSIQDTIRAVEIVTTVSLNEFQDVEVELTRANNVLFANDVRRQKLLLAYYNIRGLVGTANAQSGIDVNLAKAAFIDKRIIQLEEINAAKPVTALDVIKGKLEKIRSRPDDGRGLFGTDSVATSVLGSEQLAQIRGEIQNLKKQKQKINDEVLELNIKTEIPLSDETVSVLHTEGLV